MRDDADLRHVDGVPGREPFARSRRHRDDGIGLRYHRLEDLTLVRRRGGQHGVQDDDAWHPDLVQQVQDLAAVGAAVDAVFVLHDGDVAQVQLRGRPAERGGVIGGELRYHLVAGSWFGRVYQADDPAFVSGGAQEGAAQGGGESCQSALGWRERTDKTESRAHSSGAFRSDGPERIGNEASRD